MSLQNCKDFKNSLIKNYDKSLRQAKESSYLRATMVVNRAKQKHSWQVELAKVYKNTIPRELTHSQNQ